MRFCFHNWSKWSEPIDTANDFKKVQARYCLNCNKIEVEPIRQPFNLWFGAKQIPTNNTEKTTP